MTFLFGWGTFESRTFQSTPSVPDFTVQWKYELFSPRLFSPELYSPRLFSPELFSPRPFSPELFSPRLYSPMEKWTFQSKTFQSKTFQSWTFQSQTLQSNRKLNFSVPDFQSKGKMKFSVQDQNDKKGGFRKSFLERLCFFHTYIILLRRFTFHAQLSIAPIWSNFWGGTNSDQFESHTL